MRCPTEFTAQRFWDALEDGRFLLRRCKECDRTYYPPAPLCPYCYGDDVSWVESDETGTLYSFTRYSRTPPGFGETVVLGLVDLAEGPRVLAPIDAPYEYLEIGTRVRLDIRPYDGGYDRGPLAEKPFFAAVLR
jgi:uncharacterized OB-fold protein